MEPLPALEGEGKQRQCRPWDVGSFDVISEDVISEDIYLCESCWRML